MMQAEAGYFSLTGEPDAPPTRFGLSVVDQMTGLALAYAVLAGITGARSSGRGRDLDVSLFDVALCNLGYPAIWYLNEGHRTGRLERSAHPALTPCELYRTSDGWIYIMCNKEKFWPVLCEVLGHDEWSTDGRFKDFKGRLEHRKLIREMLDEELQKKNTSDWLKIFAGKVPAAPVNDLQGALENPFVQDEGRIQSIPLKDYGSYRTLDSPVKCGEPTPSNPAPLLGQDTEQLLTDLGYSPDHITELRDSGII
jgi:crotonobetainyl-CoA:carnitine CoA-transferase CaiB-like acyl-CoA transferase